MQQGKPSNCEKKKIKYSNPFKEIDSNKQVEDL